MKKEITKKSLAIVMNLLIISMTFSIAFNYSFFGEPSVEKVSAIESWGCCVKQESEYSNKWCVDRVFQNNCDRGYPWENFRVGLDCANVYNCDLINCIPRVLDMELPELLNADVQLNKNRAECIELQGFEANEEEIQKGCCSIPNSEIGKICGYYPKFVCREVSRRSNVEFGPDIFTPAESSEDCYIQCAKDEMGCCAEGGGICKRETRAECTEGTFWGDNPGDPTYCSELGTLQCSEEPEANQGCCNPIAIGDQEIKRNICEFSTAGNQEQIVENPLGDCEYPKGKCEVCLDDQCKDMRENVNFVSYGQPYCKSRTCEVELKGSQEISVVAKNDDYRVVTTVHSTQDELVTPILHGRSICYNFYVGQNKENPEDSVENMMGRSTGLQNQVIRCAEGEIELQGLGPEREKLCFELSNGKTQVLDNPWLQCRQCGNSSTGVIGNFLDAFETGPNWIGLLFNTKCSKDECSKLGVIKTNNSETFPGCFYQGGTIVSFMGTTLGTCDPVYVPGTTASSFEPGFGCGGGYDTVLNACDKRECESLGNYQWSKGNFATFIKGLAGGVAVFGAVRTSLTPVACAAIAFEKVGYGPQTFVEYLKCLGVQTLTYGGIAMVGSNLAAMDYETKTGEVIGKIGAALAGLLLPGAFNFVGQLL